MQLAWPWSVPRLPFSCAVRPNSDMVTSATSAMRSPMSVPEGRQRLAELAQQVGKLALGGALAHFVDVVVPAADIGERHLHADVGFDQLRDLLQAVAEAAARDTRAPAAGV